MPYYLYFIFMDLEQLFENLKVTPSEDYESDILEFKRYKDSTALFGSKDLCDEICALANSYGGKIIIGIKDSGEMKDGDYTQQLCGFEKIDLHVAKERIIS